MEVLESENKAAYADPKVGEKAEDLLKAIKFIYKVITTKPVVPILENIMFKNGMIIASDLQTTLKFITNINGNFLVPAKWLKTILENLEKDDKVSFNFVPSEDAEDKIEVLVNGNVEFSAISENVSDFPKYPNPKELLGEMNRKDILHIQKALPFVSNDELRPAMEAVFLGRQKIVSTNGHQLKYEDFTSFELTKNILLPKTAAKILADFSSAIVKVQFSSGENVMSVRLSDSEKAIYARCIDERYPNFEAVIPENMLYEFSIDPEHLEKSLKKALVCASKSTNQVILKFNEPESIQLLASDKDEETSFQSELDIEGWPLSYISTRVVVDENKNTVLDENGNPVMEDYEVKPKYPFQIGFNGNLLLNIAKQAKDRVYIKACAPNKAAITRSTFKHKDRLTNQEFEMKNHVLIMPVMIKDDE